MQSKRQKFEFDLVRFVEEHRPFDSYLSSVLDCLDFAMLRMSCKSLQRLLKSETNSNKGKHPSYLLAIERGFFRLGLWLIDGKTELDSSLVNLPRFLCAISSNPTERKPQMQLIKRLFPNRKTTEILGACAFHGNIPLMKRLRINGYNWDESTIASAAKAGKFETVKWLHKKCCPSDCLVCLYTARNADLQMLQWLKTNNFGWNQFAAAEAARNGDIGMLTWLKENGCPMEEAVGDAAASSGHIKILEWLEENNLPWGDGFACEEAAANGQIETLKWLRENGCPWDDSTPREAARNGQMKTLQWLSENGCPFDEETKKKLDTTKSQNAITDQTESQGIQ